MQEYPDDALLLLSGIQHFAFCERQWALIHLEQIWQENVLTVQGRHVHERVDDPFYNETRGDLRIVRSVPILSRRLGLQGVADVVELHRAVDCRGSPIQIPNLLGWWVPRPVEFKRGKPKPDDRDEVQLCAQAICVEEMMETSIDYADLYYWQTKRRVAVEMTHKLRSRTIELASRMHNLFETGITPPPVFKRHCKSCSLREPCQPQLGKKSRSVSAYITSILMAEEEGGT